MGLWFLCTLIFTIFSGLYFTLDKERLTPSEDYQTAVAGLFDTCRHAAVTQASDPLYSDPLYAAWITPADIDCDALYLPKGGVPNLKVPGIKIRVVLATTVSPGLSGRLVVTYIPLNNPVLSGISFNDAVRQIRAVYGAESSTGLVADTPTGHRIDNGNGISGAFVPADIQTGSMANVRLVN